MPPKLPRYLQDVHRPTSSTAGTTARSAAEAKRRVGLASLPH